MPSPRFGLCCSFLDEPIKFRTATARYVQSLKGVARRTYLKDIALSNAQALVAAVQWCAEQKLGAFRVNSQILPLTTHGVVGYRLSELDASGDIERTFRQVKALARAADVRLSFHPDQFVVLSSVHPHVVASSLAELEYQAEVAEWIGAEQLTLHGGGATDGKEAALERWVRGWERLSGRARSRVVLENDDRIYTVKDLLPLCRKQGVPLIYDVHHHRCHPDGLSEDEATDLAAATWGKREPWVHLSSPRDGWKAKDPRHHSDFIDWKDVPRGWLQRRMTVDVEAKGKERAVIALRAQWEKPRVSTPSAKVPGPTRRSAR